MIILNENKTFTKSINIADELRFIIIQKSLFQICLHHSHICDEIPNCPLRDDEMLCHFACPHNCICQGYTWKCSEQFDLKVLQENIDSKHSKDNFQQKENTRKEMNDSVLCF